MPKTPDGPVTDAPVTVELYGTLAALAGAKHVAVAARDIRGLYAGLVAQYPVLEEHLERGVSVSIDGRIYTEALFQPVGPENEVVLLPRIAGG